MCDHVLPVLDKVVAPSEDAEAKEAEAKTPGDAETKAAGDAAEKKAPPKVDIKLDIVKLLAEMAQFTGELTSETALANLYNTLLVSYYDW